MEILLGQDKFGTSPMTLRDVIKGGTARQKGDLGKGNHIAAHPPASVPRSFQLARNRVLFDSNAPLGIAAIS
jgi:hypothetical protein